MSTVRIVLVVVMAAVMGCGDAQPPVAVSPPADNPTALPPSIEDIALAFAMEKVTPALHAPATADYPRSTLKREHESPFENLKGESVDRFCVTGGVDAHNLNGAFIRNQWKVILVRDGESYKPVEVRLRDSTVFIDADYEMVFLVQEVDRQLAAKKAEADRVEAERLDYERRVREELAEMRARLSTIDDDIKKHEDALALLPPNPAGGSAYAEWVTHRDGIKSLRYQKQIIQERLAQADKEARPD